MKNQKKLSALATGTMLLGAVTAANAATEMTFEDLGTGNDLRNDILTTDPGDALLSNSEIELTCGEGKCGEGKCGEGKCGEGKCGEKSSDKSSDKSADASDSKDDKADDAKADTDDKAADPVKAEEPQSRQANPE